MEAGVQLGRRAGNIIVTRITVLRLALRLELDVVNSDLLISQIW